MMTFGAARHVFGRVARALAWTDHPQEDTAMKKVMLNPEELEVESFPTAPVADEGGTVRASVGTLAPPSCPAPLCRTYDDSICGLSQGC
jgi:hypothetical protein